MKKTKTLVFYRKIFNYFCWASIICPITHHSTICHPELVSGSVMFQCLQGFYPVAFSDTWEDPETSSG